MRKKLSVKIIGTALISVLLFSMPFGALLMNQSMETIIFAQENAAPPVQESTQVVTEKKESQTEEKTEEKGSEEKATQEKEQNPCICESLCEPDAGNQDCPICKENLYMCFCRKPEVEITIYQPSEWYREETEVKIGVEETNESARFQIKKVEAKIGRSDEWVNITSSMQVTIHQNCNILVRVLDEEGNSYEEQRQIICFDRKSPTLNAAVSNGMLTVQGYDADSGIKTIYVNGYDYAATKDGSLKLRLQQFDAGYEYFMVQAMDRANNMSEVYRLRNPYYTAPSTDSATAATNKPAEQLPQSAAPTAPSDAKGSVTNHEKTDENGNSTTAKAKGKEFYTIETDNGKVFYLIVDREGENETVHFLTAISENDLLNTTKEYSETLPMNSAALESAIPSSDGALPNNNTMTDSLEEESTEEFQSEQTDTSTEETEATVSEGKDPNQTKTYLLMGIVAAVVIAFAAYRKLGKRREEYLDEEDEEDDFSYEREEDSSESNDFFQKTESEEDTEMESEDAISDMDL